MIGVQEDRMLVDRIGSHEPMGQQIHASFFLFMVHPRLIAFLQCRIEHPFLLADNRHYFFYIWRRIFRLHAIMPYALTPGYLVCGWAWLWKIGTSLPLARVLWSPI